jgi:DnaK suppressor protein
MAEMNRENASLRKIEFAIKNFEEFGFCIDCGEDISLKRLSINPAITTCIDCQEKSERVSRSHAR